MTKVTISILIGVGVYLLGLGLFTLIKFIGYKRKYKKDLEAHEKEEHKSEDSVSTSKD